MINRQFTSTLTGREYFFKHSLDEEAVVVAQRRNGQECRIPIDHISSTDFARIRLTEKGEQIPEKDLTS